MISGGRRKSNRGDTSGPMIYVRVCTSKLQHYYSTVFILFLLLMYASYTWYEARRCLIVRLDAWTCCRGSISGFCRTATTHIPRGVPRLPLCCCCVVADSRDGKCNWTEDVVQQAGGRNKKMREQGGLLKNNKITWFSMRLLGSTRRNAAH